MRSARGRPRVWRAVRGAAEEARDGSWVEETQCETEEAETQKGEWRKKDRQTCRFSVILYMSSNCIWFLIDCLSFLRLEKQIVRFICFHLFYGDVRTFQVVQAVHVFFLDVFGIVYVASNTFKVFFDFNCIGSFLGRLGCSSCSTLSLLVFGRLDGFTNVLACFMLLTLLGCSWVVHVVKSD